MEFNDGTKYSTEEMQYVYQELINSSNKEISNREHVQNIRKTQKELSQRICPRCGGKLVKKTGIYGEFFGCDNYPKCKFVLKIK
jgi:ssDNA-binding Zn-finger/Zn-ribbon topoisomerase 1